MKLPASRLVSGSPFLAPAGFAAVPCGQRKRPASVQEDFASQAGRSCSVGRPNEVIADWAATGQCYPAPLRQSNEIAQRPVGPRKAPPPSPFVRLVGLRCPMLAETGPYWEERKARAKCGAHSLAMGSGGHRFGYPQRHRMAGRNPSPTQLSHVLCWVRLGNARDVHCGVAVWLSEGGR